MNTNIINNYSNKNYLINIQKLTKCKNNLVKIEKEIKNLLKKKTKTKTNKNKIKN